MPRIDIANVPVRTGSSYPGKLAQSVGNRSQQALGDAGGLSQFGVNLVTLQPGDLSSLRHWHTEQDEFLMVTSGVLTLVDDHCETPLGVGDCAAFPAGDANGHHLINTSDAPGTFLVVGTRTPTETGYYSDLDMMAKVDNGAFVFTRRDGSPMPEDTQDE